MGYESKGRSMQMACFFLGLLLVVGVSGAFAQNYPTKPVKIVIPFAEGSATDAVSRIVGQKLSEIWNQPVEYENSPGAGGTVGTDMVAKGPSDGYTLLVSAAYASSPSTRAKLPYDPRKDFTDIALLASQPMAVVVGSGSEKTKLSEVIEAAKAEPGKLKFGTPGVGSGAHLAAEKFRIAAGIDVIHAPTKGVPATIGATEKGDVDYTILPIAAAMKGVKKGKIRPLAVTSAKRSDMMPDIPTVAEEGIADFDETLWWGVWTRAGVSAQVADKLSNDIASALSAPDLIEELKKRGFEPMSMNREDFAQFVRKEMETVAKTVKEAGLQPQ